MEYSICRIIVDHVCYRSTLDFSCHSAVVLVIFALNKKCFLRQSVILTDIFVR